MSNWVYVQALYYTFSIVLIVHTWLKVQTIERNTEPIEEDDESIETM